MDYRKVILLAGLLHDLGKVGQRAKSPSSRQLQEQYGHFDLAPINKFGKPYNTHVWWTAHWIEQQQSFFDDKLSLQPPQGDSLLRISARHHMGWQSLSAMERIVQLADRISAGMERTGLGDGALSSEGGATVYRGVDCTSREAHREVPLLSLWAVLAMRAAAGVRECNPRASEYWGYRIRSLDLHQAVFPERFARRFSSLQKDYEAVWKGFDEEHQKLVAGLNDAQADEQSGFRAYIETLLSLLHKYFWAVPSGTYGESEPIVSLFDHLKTTACFAHCLYQWVEEAPDVRWRRFIGGRRAGQEQGGEAPESVESALKKLACEHPFLLVGGDLQGIQQFVYNIYSSKAKVALKGRSFYLQLLAEVIIERILRHPDIGAYRTHVIFASGGRFYLVLPHTQKVLRALERCYEELQRWLWAELRGDLFVGLSWVPFGFYSVSGQNVEIDSYEQAVRRIVLLQKEDQDLLNELKREFARHPYEDCRSFGQEQLWEQWKRDTRRVSLGDLWWLMAEKLGRLKLRRWSVLLSDPDEFPRLFELAREGGSVGTGTDELAICQVTGRVGRKGEVLQRLPGEEGEGIYVEQEVGAQIELGRRLGRDAVFVVLRPHTAGAGDAGQGFRGDPQDRPVVEIWGCQVFVRQNIASDGLCHGDIVWKLNDPNHFLDPNTLNSRQAVSQSFYFYGGHRQPVKSEVAPPRPATLLELSGVTERDRQSFTETLDDEAAQAPVSEEELIESGRALFERLLLGGQKGDSENEFDLLRQVASPSALTLVTGVPDLDESWGVQEDWSLPPEIRDSFGKKERAPSFATTYLAALRADVDRLGELFVFGLRPDVQSFSVLSTLSWQLSWFFSGFLNALQASDARYRRHLQIVYAGGDDVFAVGRWDVVLSFARRMRGWYQRFTACRSDTSISAGMALFRPKYPIQQATQLAGEAEDLSKGFSHGARAGAREPKTKDALCIGNTPLGWTPCHTHPALYELDEFGLVGALAGVMLRLLQCGDFSTGFLHRLVGYADAMEQRGQVAASKGSYREFVGSDYRWLWHFVYNAARIRKQSSRENGLEVLLHYLRKLFWAGDPSREIPPARSPLLVAEAARLALLYWRAFCESKKQEKADRSSSTNQE